MGNISSANFKKSKDWQVFHNADERPSYAIGGKLEFNRNGLDALKLKNQIIENAKEAYERNRKPKAPKFKATSYEWSLVVNLKESSTMQDLEKLSKHFNDKYGFQCYQIAIHRDEGHIDNGQKIINHHAHLEFITLDKETGKNNYRREKISPRVLRDMQSEVAQILQMERGVDRRLSGAKRIEPRAYGAMKEREKAQNREREQKIEKTLDSAHKTIETQNAEITTLKGENDNLKAKIKDIKAEFELKRKAWIAEQNKNKDDYRALSALKQDCLAKRNLTIEQVREYIENLEKERENERKARLKAEKERDELRSELHRAQQEKAQNREVSHKSSSAANIAQQKPQTTHSVENQPKSAAADKEIKGEKTAKIPQGVEGLTAFESGFFTSSVTIREFETAKNKASEIQKQGFKVAIFEYNNKFGILCALKSLYNDFKSKLIAKYQIAIRQEFEPKEQEPKKVELDFDKGLSEIDKALADTDAMLKKADTPQKPHKEKSNGYGMSM